MPALPIEAAANTARAIAINLVSRATPGRPSGSSSVSSTARTGIRVISGGIIAAIVVGAVVFILIVVFAICLFRRHKNQSRRRNKETQKYFGGDNRSSIGTADGTAAPPSQSYGNNYNNYNNNNTTGVAGSNGSPQGGYKYGQGYGYAHHASPGQYGYGTPQNDGGVSGVPPAYTADHMSTTK